MFNDKYALTKAVLEGKKTMTRRIATPATDKEVTLGNTNKEWFEDEQGNIYISRYKMGEEIAIAQSYSDVDNIHRQGKTKSYLEYLDSLLPKMKELAGWNNKMFVKAELMPYRIRITDIKLEALQDISCEDCLKEGIYKFNSNGIYAFDDKEGYIHSFDSVIYAFAFLINKVSGKRIWNSNPFVFVYEFELIK